MARSSKILVVLDKGAKRLPAAWRPGDKTDRFAIVRPGGPGEKLPGTSRIDAVLFQVDDGGRAAAPMKELKRLSRGAPLLPFRLERPDVRPRRRARRSSASESDAPILPITKHLDARLLENVLEREIHLAEQRQRVRRLALEARDATARMNALTAIVRL